MSAAPTGSAAPVAPAIPSNCVGDPTNAIVIAYHINFKTGEMSFFTGLESSYLERDIIKAGSRKRTGFFDAVGADVAARVASAKADPFFVSDVDTHYVLRPVPTDPSRFKYTIQKPMRGSKWGFPKGGKQTGETIEATALREFKEEVGYALPDPSRLLMKRCVVSSGKNLAVFHYQVNDTERAAIEAAFQAKQVDREGELFLGKFRSGLEVNALMGLFNQDSYTAALHFAADASPPVVMGGRRHKRTRRSLRKSITRRRR